MVVSLSFLCCFCWVSFGCGEMGRKRENCERNPSLRVGVLGGRRNVVPFVGFLVLFEEQIWVVRSCQNVGHCTGVQTDTKLVYGAKE